MVTELLQKPLQRSCEEEVLSKRTEFYTNAVVIPNKAAEKKPARGRSKSMNAFTKIKAAIVQTAKRLDQDDNVSVFAVLVAETHYAHIVTNLKVDTAHIKELVTKCYEHPIQQQDDQGPDTVQDLYLREVTRRKELEEKIIMLTGNIRIICRVKPAYETIMSYSEHDTGVLIHGETRYNLNHVFKPSSTQEEVFKEVYTTHISSILRGRNVCLFTYGQTGSGKTFTMQGSSQTVGLQELILHAVLEEVGSCPVQLSEVYNKKVFILLNKTHVTSFLEGKKFFERIQKLRKTGATKMNENSRRSHLICEIGVNDTKLYMVDLAGAERQLKSGVTGVALREAININTGLSCLGRVITSLQTKAPHVPYNDSKLTHVLRDALVSQSVIIMLAHVAADANNKNETAATLKFTSELMGVEMAVPKRLNFELTTPMRGGSAATSKRTIPPKTEKRQ